MVILTRMLLQLSIIGTHDRHATVFIDCKNKIRRQMQKIRLAQWPNVSMTTKQDSSSILAICYIIHQIACHVTWWTQRSIEYSFLYMAAWAVAVKYFLARKYVSWHLLKAVAFSGFTGTKSKYEGLTIDTTGLSSLLSLLAWVGVEDPQRILYQLKAAWHVCHPPLSLSQHGSGICRQMQALDSYILNKGYRGSVYPCLFDPCFCKPYSILSMFIFSYDRRRPVAILFLVPVFCFLLVRGVSWEDFYGEEIVEHYDSLAGPAPILPMETYQNMEALEHLAAGLGCAPPPLAHLLDPEFGQHLAGLFSGPAVIQPVCHEQPPSLTLPARQQSEPSPALGPSAGLMTRAPSPAATPPREPCHVETSPTGDRQAPMVVPTNSNKGKCAEQKWNAYASVWFTYMCKDFDSTHTNHLLLMMATLIVRRNA